MLPLTSPLPVAAVPSHKLCLARLADLVLPLALFVPTLSTSPVIAIATATFTASTSVNASNKANRRLRGKTDVLIKAPVVQQLYASHEVLHPMRVGGFQRSLAAITAPLKTTARSKPAVYSPTPGSQRCNAGQAAQQG